MSAPDNRAGWSINDAEDNPFEVVLRIHRPDKTPAAYLHLNRDELDELILKAQAHRDKLSPSRRIGVDVGPIAGATK